MTKLSVSVAVACAIIPGMAKAQDLPRSTPEAQGVASHALFNLVNALESKIDHVHSLMVVRHGNVIAEGWWRPYAADKPHMLFSLSKSFTSTAIGMLQAEGRLSINDTLVKYFPEAKSKDPKNHIDDLRLRDMLCMSTGQSEADIDKIPFVGEHPSKSFLSTPVLHIPGTLWHYNTPSTYMLSYVAQKVTGKTVRDYLGPRLFAPLGMGDPQWDQSSEGVDWGGFGLNLRTEDIAKFGQLLLQRGEFGGKRILPADWVDLATSKQASNGGNPDSDWNQGYGFQFWRCRYGAYRGDGAFCQFMVVMPEQDCVIAVTSGSNDYQGVLNVLFDNLLTELRPVPLPPDKTEEARLAARLKGLTMPPVQTGADSAAGVPVGKAFTFADNEFQLKSLTLSSGGAAPKIRLGMGGADLSFALKPGDWVDVGTIPGRTHPQMGGGLKHVSASGAWVGPHVLKIKLCFDTTPFTDDWTFDFSGGTLKATGQHNVAFGATPPVEVRLRS